jgi:3-isopropylmalate dehydrogenase
LLQLRRALGVFANLRPVRVLPALAALSPLRAEIAAPTDLLIVRELIGGVYFGQPRGRTTDGAVDTMRYTAGEIARVVRVACTLARQRRGRVTSVDKANVLETSRLWRETMDGVAREFPDVAVEHMLVDNCALQLMRNPGQFDVIVTENMFGDILSDEAGAITGSIGMLPSASIGDRPPFLYEPVHGSAPTLAGKGAANPVGAILSVALLVRHSLGRVEASRVIEMAVEEVLADGVRPRDLGGQASTVEVGDRVAEKVMQMARSRSRDSTTMSASHLSKET